MFAGEFLQYGARFRPTWRAVGPGAVRLQPGQPGPDCGGPVLLDSENRTVVQSPGWPASYQHNLNCEWVVSAPQGMKIRLTITQLR